MNVTELARQVKLSTTKLKEILPELGFDIGAKAIKVDDRVAHEIIQKLNNPTVRKKYLQTDNSQPTTSNQTQTISSSSSQQSKKILIGETIVVKDLAAQMNMPVTKLILELMKNGVMASLNQRIDFETAAIIANDLGFEIKKQEHQEEIDLEQEIKRKQKYLEDDPQNLRPRPPVIVVMGHVDHGKTKLLDAIRQTNVVDSEAGGITQHVGAYQVEKNGQLITFIDTPGHEAFSAMRSRGAAVADIAILIVAADDGIQPQTIEAISHIKSAGLPFMVAINKIDKASANIDKVKSELAETGLTPEDWGGKTITVEISAKQKNNIDGLLETLLLIYEMEKDKIQGNPKRGAVGTIIESHIDRGAGPVATCLVQTGTLNVGDTVKIGALVSRLRALKNWQGKPINQAGPSAPVQILGLKGVPQVGEILTEITNKKEIKHLNKMVANKKYKLVEQPSFVSRPNAAPTDKTENKEVKKINLILKADVFGSIEAILESLDKVQHEEVVVNVIKQGLGNINESDVEQAANLNAYLIGFNVKATPQANTLASQKEVNLQTFQIIYGLLDFIKQEVKKLLSPQTTVKELGKIKILKIFKAEKKIQIVGGKVLSGKIFPNSKIKIWRHNQLIGHGKLVELQSNKEVANEVVEGQECGLKIEETNLIQEGDLLSVFQEKNAEIRV